MGEPLSGGSLLLHREQGLGDMIMFASVLPAMIEAGLDLQLAIHPPLARVMAFNFPKARVWSSITTAGTGSQPDQRWLAAAPPIARQAPICSLGALRMPGGPPPARPYLRADPEDVALWAERLAAMAPPTAGVRRVGLVLGTRQVRWNDDGSTNALRKTLPGLSAAGLAEAKDVQWIGLHASETAAMFADVPHLDIVDPSPWISDMADTAAIIETLDLVVSADTAVAHLAGAMGKPVYLMLWWNPDWRWGIDRQDCDWYPHVRLFRQPRPGDWSSVVEAIVRALG